MKYQHSYIQKVEIEQNGTVNIVLKICILPWAKINLDLTDLNIDNWEIIYLRHSVTRFSTIVFAYKIRPGPHMNRRKQFRELFHFRKDFWSQNSKIACPRSKGLHGHVKNIFDTDVFIFLNYCYWVCKHTQVPFFTWLFL